MTPAASAGGPYTGSGADVPGEEDVIWTPEQCKAKEVTNPSVLATRQLHPRRRLWNLSCQTFFPSPRHNCTALGRTLHLEKYTQYFWFWTRLPRGWWRSRIPASAFITARRTFPVASCPYVDRIAPNAMVGGPGIFLVSAGRAEDHMVLLHHWPTPDYCMVLNCKTRVIIILLKSGPKEQLWKHREKKIK